LGFGSLFHNNKRGRAFFRRSLLLAAVLPAAAIILLPTELFGQEERPHDQGEETVEKLPAACQNPILRDYFRRRYPGFRFEGETDDFVEEFVDRQIDSFLRTVDEKLEKLKSTTELLARLQERGARLESESNRAEIRRAFIGTLKKSEDLSDDLRDLLAVVFLGLDRKGDFKEAISLDAEARWFAKEVDYIRRHVEEADTRIREYLFDTKNVVDAVDLRKESMMVCLFFAEQMAKSVRKRLKRHR